MGIENFKGIPLKKSDGNTGNPTSDTVKNTSHTLNTIINHGGLDDNKFTLPKKRNKKRDFQILKTKDDYITYLKSPDGLNDLAKRGHIIINRDHSNEITSIDFRQMMTTYFLINGKNSNEVLQIISETSSDLNNSVVKIKILIDFFKKEFGLETENFITKSSVALDYFKTPEGLKDIADNTNLIISKNEKGDITNVDFSKFSLNIKDTRIMGFHVHTYLGHLSGLGEKISTHQDAIKILSLFFSNEYGISTEKNIYEKDDNQPFIDYMLTEEGLNLFLEKSLVTIEKNDRGDIVNVDCSNMISPNSYRIYGVRGDKFIRMFSRNKSNLFLRVGEATILIKRFFTDHYNYKGKIIIATVRPTRTTSISNEQKENPLPEHWDSFIQNSGIIVNMGKGVNSGKIESINLMNLKDPSEFVVDNMNGCGYIKKITDHSSSFITKIQAKELLTKFFIKHLGLTKDQIH